MPMEATDMFGSFKHCDNILCDHTAFRTSANSSAMMIPFRAGVDRPAWNSKPVYIALNFGHLTTTQNGSTYHCGRVVNAQLFC